MANEQNLKPHKKGELSKEEAKRIGRKGGLKRVENIRKRKTLKECAQVFASLKPTDNVIKQLEQLGVDSKDANYLMAMIVGVGQKAMKGDAKALKTITELIGEDTKLNLEQQRFTQDTSIKERELELRERELALREEEFKHKLALDAGEIKEEDKVIIVNDIEELKVEDGKKKKTTAKGNKVK